MRGGDQDSELIFLLFRAPTDCVQWFTGTTGTFRFLKINGYEFQLNIYWPDLHVLSTPIKDSLEENTVDSGFFLNVSKKMWQEL